MKHTGHCYCGDLHYEFTGPVHSQILCHCRECRYLSGGAANTSIVISESGLVTDLFRSFNLVFCRKGVLKWQTDIVRNSNEMRCASL